MRGKMKRGYRGGRRWRRSESSSSSRDSLVPRARELRLPAPFKEGKIAFPEASEGEIAAGEEDEGRVGVGEGGEG